MKSVGWRHKSILLLALVVLMGCSLPSPPPSLNAAAAQSTVDGLNPAYCKVVEFYGFYRPGDEGGQTLVAYVSVVNPSESSQKQTVFAARFQLINRTDGRRQWFLTSLISHASGLSRRWGWDNLMIPVKETAAADSR